MSVARALAMIVVLATTARAHAQSTRYPPKPIDPDVEASHDSQLWDRATDPVRAPYCDALTEARRRVELRTTDDTIAAIAALDRAVALRPTAPDAFARRGTAYAELQRWHECADDLQAAEDHATAAAACTGIAIDAAEQRRTLGICQARAGRLGAAERTLAQLASAAGTNAELWVRLGETRIAMGKLDEAIAALGDAVRASDPSQQGFMHWLLASAYDRARRPAEAASEAALAAGTDRSFATIASPGVPLIGTAESEYLLGLAYESTDSPEPALVYFRRFVALAPHSPWRRRADEHVAALARLTFPTSLAHPRGNAALNQATALTTIQHAMPKLRACLAKLPGVVLSVQVTRAGPKQTEVAKDRPHVWGAPAGVAILTVLDLDGAMTTGSGAPARCVDALATALPLPAVTERDAWYQVTFVVVAP